jgi:hypothetical protein
MPLWCAFHPSIHPSLSNYSFPCHLSHFIPLYLSLTIYIYLTSVWLSCVLRRVCLCPIRGAMPDPEVCPPDTHTTPRPKQVRLFDQCSNWNRDASAGLCPVILVSRYRNRNRYNVQSISVQHVQFVRSLTFSVPLVYRWISDFPAPLYISMHYAHLINLYLFDRIVL